MLKNIQFSAGFCAIRGFPFYLWELRRTAERIGVNCHLPRVIAAAGTTALPGKPAQGNLPGVMTGYPARVCLGPRGIFICQRTIKHKPILGLNLKGEVRNNPRKFQSIS
jgi:hypothetical protein